jgi:hypothetical protein
MTSSLSHCQVATERTAGILIRLITASSKSEKGDRLVPQLTQARTDVMPA